MNLPTPNSAHGFVRIACAAPEVFLGDPLANTNEIVRLLSTLEQEGVQIALFPELCLTGYSCADLFYQKTLLDGAITGLGQIAAATAHRPIAAVVGLPLEIGSRIYNCAALVSDGRVVGIVPKQFLPNRNEFYEQRWFTSSTQLDTTEVEIAGDVVPISNARLGLTFPCVTLPGLTLGIEICEDLWTAIPPSGDLAVAGANLILNPSASDEMVGKAAYRRDLVVQQSARCLAAYAYASCGATESTTDVVYSGHLLIAEDGHLLAEGKRFSFSAEFAIADIDIELLSHDRLKNSSFATSRSAIEIEEIPFALGAAPEPRTDLRRVVAPHPFVPGNPAHRAANAEEVFTIQAHGLARRLRHIGLKKVTIGISGGLDSTLALLVTVRAFDLLGLDRKGIVAITMPGPGTTERTKGNADQLMDFLGLTARTIPIGPATELHLRDIGHPPGTHDITFENAQARERTQVLMDVANQIGGLVVGTGDLSESALGWCTFNGDHMSMYHVNSGVPKTLVKFLITWCADEVFTGNEAAVLRDIVATPISPELLPTSAEGEIQQITEDTIGPYELHDFFLYHAIRHGAAPKKILFLANHAFASAYDEATLLKWLKNFYWRFFSNQFKRSSMPDGPKVGSVALSPRGDWRMPSDAKANAWIRELENP